MKQFKATIMEKEPSTCSIGNKHLRLAINICFCLSLVFLVITLAIFVHDQTMKVLPSNEVYIPLERKSSTFSHALPVISCNPSLLACFSYTAIISARTSTTKNQMIPNNPWHSVSDKELISRVSEMLHCTSKDIRRPKVAFMFLSRRRLPLAPLWEIFFKGHEEFYSIYWHTSPDFNQEPPNSSVFYKRRIPSQAVEWGKATMVDVERRLIANALLDDYANQRFVLLSESCIPLFNFTTIYDYLINSNTSFLGSFDDPRPIGRGRYNKRMWPTISLHDWRKGSQWFEIQREVAIQIVSDQVYYLIFRQHCKPPCYVDEHYFPTLVTKLCPTINSNRSITWVDWSKGGSHPTKFTRKDISQVFLNNIRYGYNCSYNGSYTSICFLFARKFHPNTLEPLLKIAPKLLQFEISK